MLATSACCLLVFVLFVDAYFYKIATNQNGIFSKFLRKGFYLY